MNKAQFTAQLTTLLQQLPSSEREDILRDYEEHFAIGAEQGNSEAHIAAALGSPRQIAKEVLALYQINKAEASTTPGNVLRAVWAAIGMGLFNTVIVLAPMTAIVLLLVAGWVSGIAGAASPLLVITNTIATPSVFELFDFTFSLLLCGIGLLVLIGMRVATSFFIRGFVRYLKFNISIVKGGMKHDEHA